MGVRVILTSLACLIIIFTGVLKPRAAVSFSRLTVSSLSQTLVTITLVLISRLL